MTLVVDVPDCEAAHIVDVVARIGGDRDRDLDMASFCDECVGKEKWTSGRSDPPKVGPCLAFLRNEGG